ncbi:hypothetical protein [Actinoplanes rectilineatus]|uniref:hypothetical protein n=1 Tax=Actinoplanes rectilineatus TaxID=113571 RepID=UPI0012FC706C|nr:hypothetical protein [Actinoplanes rectilineatus]
MLIQFELAKLLIVFNDLAALIRFIVFIYLAGFTGFAGPISAVSLGDMPAGVRTRSSDWVRTPVVLGLRPHPAA